MEQPIIPPVSKDVLISEVVVDGVPYQEGELLREKMHVKAGMRASKWMIEKDVATIFGKGAYDYVNYELRGTEEPYKLRIYCKRGPMHQTGFSARMDTRDLVSLLVNVGLNTRAVSGHSLDLTARISTNPYLDVTYAYNAPHFTTFNVRSMVRYSNRMNLFTVMKATKGLGAYLAGSFPDPSCAVSYDSRIHSMDFAKLAAAVLAERASRREFAELMPHHVLRNED